MRVHRYCGDNNNEGAVMEVDSKLEYKVYHHYAPVDMVLEKKEAKEGGAGSLSQSNARTDVKSDPEVSRR